MYDEILQYIFLFLIGYYFNLIFSSAGKSIRKWVQENNLTLISKELRLFKTGPYFLTANRPVYKIVARGSDNIEKTYWIRCNSLFGLDPNQFEVRIEKNKKKKKKFEPISSGDKQGRGI